tara:strand:- start:506 stop:661 length:156 start_codon:yes stop_codon:yes gene_type:complete
MKIIGKKDADRLISREQAKFVREKYCFESKMTFGIILWRDENFQYLLRKGI